MASPRNSVEQDNAKSSRGRAADALRLTFNTKTRTLLCATSLPHPQYAANVRDGLCANDNSERVGIASQNSASQRNRALMASVARRLSGPIGSTQDLRKGVISPIFEMAPNPFTALSPSG